MVKRKASTLPKEQLMDGIASFLKALADPTRLRILHALQGGERCVNDLLAELPCTQANVSKHLALLRAAGIVEFRRQGVQIYYRIADPAVFAICGVVCGALERSLDGRREGVRAGKSAFAAGARA
jgi:DNA-binding transcriptional ArsR family regulator